MNEWTVVSVLVVLAGLIAAAVKPIVSLNGTITRLTEAVRVLEKNIESISGSNSTAHARLWEKSVEHDKKISDHEFRLKRIEEK